jgi:hypothetical protein
MDSQPDEAFGGHGIRIILRKKLLLRDGLPGQARQ